MHKYKWKCMSWPWILGYNPTKMAQLVHTRKTHQWSLLNAPHSQEGGYEAVNVLSREKEEVRNLSLPASADWAGYFMQGNYLYRPETNSIWYLRACPSKGLLLVLWKSNVEHAVCLQLGAQPFLILRLLVTFRGRRREGMVESQLFLARWAKKVNNCSQRHMVQTKCKRVEWNVW